MNVVPSYKARRTRVTADPPSPDTLALLAHRVRELERALERSEARHRQIGATLASGIALVGVDGRVREINDLFAELVGRPADEIVGRPLSELMATEQCGCTGITFDAGSLDDVQEREISILHPSGQSRTLRARSSPLREGGELVGLYFIFRDVTEEQAREAQLRRAERLASVAPLLSGVCHELNNPLTSIRSFAELLLLDERSEEDREALEIIRREAERAGRIVTDLRLVARQKQDEAVQAGWIDLNDLVRRSVHTHSDDFRKYGITVELDLHPQLRSVYGVASQLERVVAQLFTNAAAAVRTGERQRRISIDTSPSEMGSVVRVRDTGPGIPPEQVERIFDPFWTGSRAGGTGLGLSLLHSIVDDHHGRVRVDGGWRRGATFTIDLPGGRDAQIAAPPATAGRRASHPLRVLIVDDEGPIRFSVARYLERRGHSVQDAAEGEEALRLIEEAGPEGFDVILADLRMPRLNGEGLLSRLREIDGAAERLIFMTGDAESADVAEALARTEAPVVLKPFELAEIAQIIEAHARMVGTHDD